MSIFIIITIAFSSLIFWEIFALGRYFSIKNFVFQKNIFANFTFGSTIWFSINFLIFLPLVFLQTQLIYFLILFVIKEFITGIFLIGRNSSIYKNIDIKRVVILYIIVWSFSIIYIYLISPYIVGEINPYTNNFGTLTKLIESLSQTSGVSQKMIKDWTLTPLAVGIIFSIIHYFIKRMTKWESYINVIISILILFTIILGTSSKFSIYEILSFAILVWGLILATNIIIMSRRRYTVFYSIAFLAAWSINSYVFAAFLVIAILTTIIYTSSGGRKVYLFWLQMILPIASISSLYLYNYSITLTVLLLITLIFAYLFLMFGISEKVHAVLNDLFYKTKWVLPVLIFLIFLILGSISYNYVNMDSLIINQGFINIKNNVISIVNTVAYWSLFASLILINFYFWINKTRIIKYVIFLRYFLWYLVFIYNPLFESMLHYIKIDQGFIYPLSFVIWLPMISILFIQAKEIYYKKVKR